MAYNKETDMWEGFIYKIWNDVNDKIYIGLTTQTPKKRFLQHLKAHRKTKNENISRFDKVIGEIGEDNFHYTVIKFLSDDNKNHLIIMLKKFEKYYIKKYKTNNNLYGYNISAGGDDFKIYGKPVWQYDLDGNFIREYPTAVEAADATGTHRADICHCCRNERSVTVGGYYWSYKGKKYRTDTYRMNRKVNVYDLDGNYIKTYDCVNAISEDKKFKRKVRDCCTGYKYNVNGLVYRYENDSFDKYPTEYKNKTWFKKGIKNG